MCNLYRSMDNLNISSTKWLLQLVGQQADILIQQATRRKTHHLPDLLGCKGPITDLG